MLRHKNFADEPQLAIEAAFDMVSKNINRLRSKSTCAATVMFIREREMWIGWVGNVKAVLCSNGKAVTLTTRDGGAGAPSSGGGAKKAKLSLLGQPVS